MGSGLRAIRNHRRVAILEAHGQILAAVAVALEAHRGNGAVVEEIRPVENQRAFDVPGEDVDDDARRAGLDEIGVAVP
jgi:hypothetical protein